jgi:hypothetical protein
MWVTGSTSGGWWVPNPPGTRATVQSRAAAGLEFLRQYAGADSYWVRQASAAYGSVPETDSSVSGPRSVGAFLASWADQVEAGVIDVAGTEALAEINVVNTDVMTQVRALIEDQRMHPAAPIVLCGAALEVALRATVDAHDLDLTERPSLSAYAKRLRQAGVITAQDMKDIEQCGGLRNAAAHGQFDVLSAERAGLMEQQTNLLLRRLEEIAPS